MTRWVARSRGALQGGALGRIAAWIWVVLWGEHALTKYDSGLAAIMVAVSVVAFLGWEATHEGWPRLWPLVATVMMGSVIVLSHQGYSVSSAYLCGWLITLLALSLRARVAAPLALIALAAMVLAEFGGDSHGEHASIGVIGSLQHFLAVYMLLLIARTAQRLQRTQEDLASTEVDAERTRLAQNLNTLVGETLHDVARQAAAARASVGVDKPDVQEHLGAVEQLVGRGLEQLDQLALEPVIDDFASELRTARILCERLGVDLSGAEEPLDAQVGETFALLLRESVTNMFKHAQPTRCTVVARTEGGESLFSFINDGARADAARVPGSGQARWAAQLEPLGGTLEVGPLAEGRYRVLARVPAAAKPAAAPRERATHG